MENGNGDVFWNVERCTKGGREQYEFVTKMDNFPLFEFHCNIAKQLIKCESFHCKYTMLFQLPVCIYIYIYVCIYARISIIWNFYPGYVKSWLEQIYFPIREYAICWKFSIYFFFFFPIVCDQFAERNKLLGDRSGWDPIEGRGTDGDKSGRDLLVRTRDFRWAIDRVNAKQSNGY